MSATFTPGPWLQSDGDECAIFAENGTAIGTVFTGADFPCLDDGEQEAAIPECEANARLIAAAPELLEALEGLTRYAEAVRMSAGMGKSQLARLDAAKAAIAKARGQ